MASMNPPGARVRSSTFRSLLVRDRTANPGTSLRGDTAGERS